jgi:hypothetical protein
MGKMGVFTVLEMPAPTALSVSFAKTSRHEKYMGIL